MSGAQESGYATHRGEKIRYRMPPASHRTGMTQQPTAEEIQRRLAEQHAYLGTLRIARICKEQVTARLGEGWAK